MPASPAMAQNLSMSSEDSHRFFGVHAGVTPEQSGQCSAAVSEIIAVVIQCHIIIHTQSFYEPGVHCSDVAAYTFEHDRYVRAYPVQIAAVRHPFVTGEKLLVPSCSMETIGHPVRMFCDEPAASCHKLVSRPDVIDADFMDGFSEFDDMHVTVVEPGYHRPAATVIYKICRCGAGHDVCFAPGMCDDTALDHQGFRETAPFHIYFTVADNDSTHFSLRLLMLSVRTLWLPS